MDLLFGWDSMVTPPRLAPATCMQPALAQPQVLPLVADFDISDPNHVDDEEVRKEPHLVLLWLDSHTTKAENIIPAGDSIENTRWSGDTEK